ncbi:GntR family transcriptional regulator, partial [Planotetraspora phitsanulokensis]
MANLIRERIRSGHYGTDGLISEVALEAELGVARPTIRKAIG